MELYVWGIATGLLIALPFSISGLRATKRVKIDK
ncbi:hypothetical protein EV380_1009 [Zhihengliuella halotolerans]|uniref:Uncharacterized protein n=1 Tax=Zhihengliuella halotolerans TaxID=370736 RepID=A0A4Q8AD41_9MICC|nr:hypothetical protein EV380_1009 [Zhihengliuella halotolerans]